ncbi:MAG: transglycosylase domain-containing protein [Bacteroidales bacterium]|jgi:penicillin-binding protein 1A|nr:transglycosylase domain-containing protein [Bacteroidales bacterium]MDX9927788.1 transglycosylase domain-containing protein [Bacteroidales bacterium]HNX84500.1 transglycosylase domain-containing protein [Bacteroidales bacterium]HPS98186.1 transglycosylase domain-containing protein [Bacteroidales bacterium]
MKRGWKIAVVALGVIIFIPVFFISSVQAGIFGRLPGKKELSSFRNATASVVLSHEGETIGRFFSENRITIPFDQMPPHLINALVATEDARFYEHSGVDSRSLIRVVFKTILFSDRSAGGGSTITQQLAKNMYGRKDYRVFSVILNKTREVILAKRIEKVFTKDEILNLYLNTVSFGENIYGIEAASQRYFSKKAADLKVEEAALLTGMLKANTMFNPRLYPQNAVRRRNVVLGQMEKYGYLAGRAADSLSALPIKLNYSKTDLSGPADYFMVRVRMEADRILKDISAYRGKEWDLERDGLVITTTLRLPLQQAAGEAFAAHMPRMQKRLDDQYSTSSGRRALKEIPDSLKKMMTTLHAGLFAMDPATGAVMAWTGGIDFKTQPYDQVLARRQLASVFKPFIYAAALEDGVEPCTYLDNDSVTLSGFNDWSPENYNHSYGGKYSLAGALAQSMNIPTFSLFLMIGFDNIDRLWQQMGFSFPLVNMPSLAMGTAEASILEVARAYAAFANGGMLVTPYLIESVKAPDGRILWQYTPPRGSDRVLSERSATLMAAMLEKAIREGTGASVHSVYGVKIPLAGKTGTSQSYADAWFAAFNPAMVIVSRVGASTPSIHFNSGSYGSGSALALPLVAMTLKKAEKNKELMSVINTPFAPLPPELAMALDCPDFREKSFFDRLIDIFRDNNIDYQKETRRRRIIRGRIFKI